MADKKGKAHGEPFIFFILSLVFWILSTFLAVFAVVASLISLLNAHLRSGGVISTETVMNISVAAMNSGGRPAALSHHRVPPP